MRVTVTVTNSDDIFNLDVSEDLELENFKAFCEVESGIPAAEISLVFNGKIMEDGAKSLKSHGLKEGDVIVIQRQRPTSSRQQQGGKPYELFFLILQNSSYISKYLWLYL